MKHVFLVTLELVVDGDRHEEYTQEEAADYVTGVMTQLQPGDSAENVTAYKLEVKK
jgi:hypothetical protein